MILLILITVLFLAALFLAAVTAQGIALAIAGVVAPILAQFIKKWFGASGFAAVLLAAVVAGLIAVAATFIAGEAHSFGDVVKNAVAVFGIATLVYRAFLAAIESPTSPG